MRNYEDQAQRRARKVADIKEMFYRRLSEENRREKSARGTRGNRTSTGGFSGNEGAGHRTPRADVGRADVLAFGKEIATVDTALLNRQSNSCLRSPQGLQILGDPIILNQRNGRRFEPELNSGLMDEGERRFLSAKLGGCKRGNAEWDSG